MATPSVNIQIFGHSFVKRLKDFIRRSEDISFSLGLSGNHLIQYSGIPGATVEVLRRNLDLVKDFQPDILILLIGTCDIYNRNLSAECVANKIIDFVDYLLFTCGVGKMKPTKRKAATIAKCDCCKQSGSNAQSSKRKKQAVKDSVPAVADNIDICATPQQNETSFENNPNNLQSPTFIASNVPHSYSLTSPVVNSFSINQTMLDQQQQEEEDSCSVSEQSVSGPLSFDQAVQRHLEEVLPGLHHQDTEANSLFDVSTPLDIYSDQGMLPFGLGFTKQRLYIICVIVLVHILLSFV
ncbi:hypothetical protein ACF0H5_003485 [Mactra antiquata]